MRRCSCSTSRCRTSTCITRCWCWSIWVRLARERGKGVLFTVHDLNLAARFASHALLLTPQGTVRQGPIGEVMTEEDLHCAFGHRVTRVQAAGRTLFVPA